MEKTCQNCNQSFILEADDLGFCKKISVPFQTWCADCCCQRRMAFRNERSLYKRKDSKTNKEIIATYSPDSPYKTYQQKIWWGDDWDPMDYGRNYDFSKPFLVQLHELIKDVPWPGLFNFNDVNSDYCNITTDNKNCYLVFGGDFNENCSYSQFNFYSNDSQDLYWVNKMELCYECIDSEKCFKTAFSTYSRDCSDSAFLYNCVGCQNCFGCVNLRNKSYNILNKQYSKEDYNQKIKELDISSYSNLKKTKEQFKKFKLQYPNKYAEILKVVNCTGNNIHNAKNCTRCFDVYEGAEDLNDTIISGWNAKDSRNSNHYGHGVELLYESWATFDQSQRIFFSGFIQGSHDVLYSQGIFSCSNLFGCAGLRKKQYCILNKQYKKEEYNKLVPQIIKHMDDLPYTDKKGRIYKYGEYPPIEHSPYAYNETVAQEYYPLTKEKAFELGYRWRDEEGKNHGITIQAKNLPDTIQDTKDGILREVIGCEHEGRCNEKCSTAFKIVPSELQFYRKINLPLPRLCSNCRHYQRFNSRNPLKLWRRKCQCGGGKSEDSVYQNTASHSHGNGHCEVSFETSYAPNRPEIVYCQQCYQQEIV